jgi:hypothetical protein
MVAFDPHIVCTGCIESAKAAALTSPRGNVATSAFDVTQAVALNPFVNRRQFPSGSCT